MESGSIFADQKLIAVCSNVHNENYVICRKMSSFLKMLKPIMHYEIPPQNIRAKLNIVRDMAIKDIN